MKPLKLNVINKTEFHYLKDEELVKLIVQSRNTLVFELLYNRYEAIVYNKILGFGLSESKAKLITGDFFLDLYKNLKSFKNTSKFSFWMYFRVYKHCIGYVQNNTKIAKESELSSNAKRHLNLDVSDAILYRMNPLKLKKVIQNIELEERAILLLRYQDEITVKELQTLYQFDEAEIKENLRKAKARIVEIYNMV